MTKTNQKTEINMLRAQIQQEAVIAASKRAERDALQKENENLKKELLWQRRLNEQLVEIIVTSKITER